MREEAGMPEFGDDAQIQDVQVPTAEVQEALEDSFKLPDLAEVRAAHVRLMRAYVSAIAAASRVEPPSRPVTDSILAPFLVRRFVGRHIRRRLTELGTIYLQLGQAMYDAQGESADPWLAETSAGCMAMAERLPRWPWPGIAVVTSLALPALGLLSKIHGSSLALVAAVLADLIFIFLWLAFGAGRRAYLRKRELFLPGAGKIDREHPGQQRQAAAAGNIYLLEDTLYEKLQRGKKRERQVDNLLTLWTTFAVLDIAIVLTAAYLSPYWIIPEIVVFAIVLSVLSQWVLRRRVWR
jgi:hypothetical protein